MLSQLLQLLQHVHLQTKSGLALFWKPHEIIPSCECRYGLLLILHFSFRFNTCTFLLALYFLWIYHSLRHMQCGKLFSDCSVCTLRFYSNIYSKIPLNSNFISFLHRHFSTRWLKTTICTHHKEITTWMASTPSLPKTEDAGRNWNEKCDIDYPTQTSPCYSCTPWENGTK